MIEGLKIELTSAELIEHLKDRAEHHAERAGFYLGESGKIAQYDPDSDDNVQFSGAVDPVRQMREKVRQHKRQHAFFMFMAEHVIDDETYRLTENDLTRLELLDRYL